MQKKGCRVSLLVSLIGKTYTAQTFYLNNHFMVFKSLKLDAVLIDVETAFLGGLVRYITDFYYRFLVNNMIHK